MLLQSGEQISYSEEVETGPGGTKHEGTLYLTNVRLVFERAAGKGPAGPVTLLNAHLSSVTNVLVHSPRFGRELLAVETKTGTYSFRTKDARVWTDRISSARSQAPPPPPPRPSRSAPAPTTSTQPIVIQLQQDKAPPSVYLHCTHCGTLNAAGTTHCASCGAAL